jgi:hypothetical protein
MAIVGGATGCTQNAFISLENTVELVEIARREIGVLGVLSRINIEVPKINGMQS